MGSLTGARSRGRIALLRDDRARHWKLHRPARDWPGRSKPSVYLSEHARIGRRAAIKLMRGGLNESNAARLFDEARSASSISNQHIVQVFDCGELDDGTCYYIMEWLDGRTLADALASERPFSPARAVHIAVASPDALAATHKQGIVHRDLKPQNLMLIRRAEGWTTSSRCSTSAWPRWSTKSDVDQTESGLVIGTTRYMAPEQCRGGREVDHRCDVYALGLIFYQ